MPQQVSGQRSCRLLAIAALALACVLLAAPAGAGAAPLPSASAYVTNGSVFAVALDGAGRSYIGGFFTQVGPRIGHGLKLTSSGDQPAIESLMTRLERRNAERIRQYQQQHHLQ